MADPRGVSFVVDGELYAVPFDWVTELVDDPEFVPLPDESAASGLARVRDRWVPVVPLGSAARRGARAQPRSGTMIVVGGSEGRLGIWADEVRGLVQGAKLAGAGRDATDGADAVTATPEGVVTWIDPVELIGGREDLLLARGDVMEGATARPPDTHIVEFRLEDDDFGISVSRVYEVIRYPEVRTLPHTPPFLEGAAELRGAVLPVVDLRKRFGLSPGPPGSETRVVVTDLGGERVGLVVDRVVGVRRVKSEELRPPPKFFKGVAARYLEAMVHREGRNVVVLNTDEILTSKEKIQLRGGRRRTPPRTPDAGS